MTDWEALGVAPANMRAVASLRRACEWMFEEDTPLIDAEYGSLQDEAAKLLAAGARYALTKCSNDALISVDLDGHMIAIPVSVLRSMLHDVWLRRGSLTVERVDGILDTLVELASPKSLVLDVGSGSGLRILSVARSTGCRSFAYDRRAEHVSGLIELSRLNGVQNLEARWVEVTSTGGARPPASSEWDESIATPEGRNSIPITTIDTLIAQIPTAPFDRMILCIDVPKARAVVEGAGRLIQGTAPIVVLADGDEVDGAVNLLSDLGYVSERRGDHYLSLLRRTNR